MTSRQYKAESYKDTETSTVKQYSYFAILWSSNNIHVVQRWMTDVAP